MFKSLKKPLIKMIFNFIHPKSYFRILQHSFAFQRLLDINYNTYHYVNLLMRELNNIPTGPFYKNSVCITNLMDISEISKEDMTKSQVLILYTQLKKMNYLSETETDNIFRHFICTVNPKFLYISCNSHMEAFDKFHNELSSSKLIICASRFEIDSFYNTLSKYQSQIFYITINSKNMLTLTDMINVRYIKFNNNGHHFLDLSQIIPLFPINKKPVIYCLDLNHLNDSTIPERAIRKVIVQCKDPNEEKPNDLLFNSSTISLKDKSIHALLFCGKKQSYNGEEKFFELNQIGIQYPKIFGIYNHGRSTSFMVKFKDNSENQCLSDITSIAIPSDYDFPPDLSFPDLQEIKRGFSCLNSQNFPNIKHINLYNTKESEKLIPVLEKYSNQFTSLVIGNELLPNKKKILEYQFYQVECLTIYSALHSSDLNLFTLNFSLNKIKKLLFHFKDDSLYNKLFQIQLPNLEEIESEAPLSNQKDFSLLCENYPKMKVLNIPITITPTDFTIKMIVNSAFSQSIEKIALSKEFFKYSSILMKYLPRLTIIMEDTYKTPLQNNVMIYGNANSDVDENNGSGCIIY